MEAGTDGESSPHLSLHPPQSHLTSPYSQVHCEAQAKHTIVGARTERVESSSLYTGLRVSGAPVTLVEGGAVAHLVLTATVPVLCSPQDRALGDCCVQLHLGLGAAGGEERCPWGGLLHRVRGAGRHY